jgi:hypothetical protein
MALPDLEVGCSPTQWTTLKTACVKKDHRIHCPKCGCRNEILNMKLPPGIVIRGPGGWLCLDCKTELKREIKEHMKSCSNFPK